VVCSNCVYGGTFAFMKTYLPLKAGISVSFVDITDLAAVEAAFTNKTKVSKVWPCKHTAVCCCCLQARAT
jgi:O-acetylhomoserine/O-acetylserine sulfhydrylase-like pyridoxal-dependent enzyme